MKKTSEGQGTFSVVPKSPGVTTETSADHHGIMTGEKIPEVINGSFEMKLEEFIIPFSQEEALKGNI